jgi:hypothetical protein
MTGERRRAICRRTPAPGRTSRRRTASRSAQHRGDERQRGHAAEGERQAEVTAHGRTSPCARTMAGPFCGSGSSDSTSASATRSIASARRAAGGGLHGDREHIRMRSGVSRTKHAIDLLLRQLQAADRVRHPFPSRKRWKGRPRQEERGRPRARPQGDCAATTRRAPDRRKETAGCRRLLRSPSDWTAGEDHDRAGRQKPRARTPRTAAPGPWTKTGATQPARHVRAIADCRRCDNL